MADPTTPNVQLAVPVRGSDVGTWDVPVNGDFNIIDSALGGVTTLGLSGGGTTLTSSQCQNAVIRLTGTLISNATITIAGIYKGFTIDNQLLNSPSSFFCTLISTSGASILGIPPGSQDVFYDGVSLKYRNLGRLGQYWDYCGSAVPNWVTACTLPPYLNCDGTSFSSAAYPQLANLLGSNVLPDTRGRFRVPLNQGTGRMTASGGVDGNTLYAGGGAQTITLALANLPPYTPSGSVSAPSVTITAAQGFTTTGSFQALVPSGLGNIPSQTFGCTQPAFAGFAQGGTSTPFGSLPPALVAGITMIKAY